MPVDFTAKPHPEVTDEICERLDRYWEEADRSKVWDAKVETFPTGKEILALDSRQRILTICEIARRSTEKYNYRLFALRSRLMLKNLPFTSDDLVYLLAAVAESQFLDEVIGVLRAIRHFVDSGNKLTDQMLPLLEKMHCDFKLMTGVAEYRKAYLVVQELLKYETQAEADFKPEPGDAWADALQVDITSLPDEKRRTWGAILFHSLDSEASKPSAKWENEAKKNIEAVGRESFVSTLSSSLNRVTTPVNQARNIRGIDYHGVSQINITLLRGLTWYAALVDAPEMVRAIAHVAEVAFRKIPGVGPWGTRAGNAAIGALGRMTTMEAVGQLCRLRLRISFRPARALVEKGIEEAAIRAGITRIDLEDMAVPTYGLDMSGNWTETFGDFRATVTLTPSGEVQVQWYSGDKPLKSVPGAVKKQYAAELKEFKGDVDALGKMLTAQRDRLEYALFPRRTWTLDQWRERYLNHPLLGYLTRRLLWQIMDGENVVVVLPQSDGLSTLDGDAAPEFSEAATVTLWHPIQGTVTEVSQWRDRLETLGIVQPFKQAHREVYLLTEAERTTRTYSNRFASHILKQHQMNSLMALRGWKNQLHLLVDDMYPPPTRELPEFGLRAEFWVEGIGHDYGQDTTETGTYLYMTTDQVRFYRLDASRNYVHAGGGGYESWRNEPAPEPVPLEEIPPLVFSEIMRDVDLFVGVSSVGNDPNWADGGREGRHRDYWEHYAFGELTATAKTRAEVLARMLPCLKIASRVKIEGRFLVVQGDIRGYKIHLGSGNILMTPNDQYLCIVEDRSKARDGLFVPFEGDYRLSLILSKAFMLAEDKKITDVTITRQIGSGK